MLSDVRSYLAARYENELGQILRDEPTTNDRDPVWRVVNVQDLRTRAEPAMDGTAGILLDPELGLVLFVIPYAKGCNLRAQAIIASSLQSSLQPVYPPVPPSDEDGSWQAAIHWLVEEAARADWEAQIVQLRQETGFSEELVLDAVFYPVGGLDLKLVEHGLPRLLITTRHVLRQTDEGEAAKWMSADQAVLRELGTFQGQFTDPEQRRRAALVQDQLGEVVLAVRAGDDTAAGSPRELISLEVQDFRNLGHVRLHFGHSPVSCRVIHGPNGTGKTSLFEALSLALFHSSTRYKAFLRREERDVTGSDRPRLYAEKYLTPFGRFDRPPRIGLNGNEATPPKLVDSWEKAYRLDLEYSGNLLAQESSQEFLQLSSDDLAIRVLTGYSEFAERLEAFVDESVDKATRRRQAFLRNLGLPASITRIDTALARIAEQIVQRHFQPPHPSLLAWFDQVTEMPVPAIELSNLRNDWRQWGDDSERAKLAAKIASSPEPEAMFMLENWITHRNLLTRRTEELTERLDEKLSPIREHFDETLRDLTAWGEWLERCQTQDSKKSLPASDLDALRRQLTEIQTAQQKTMKDGQAARLHLDHLEQVITAIPQGLVAKEPNKCPTCGADHTTQGGIAKVVAQLRDQVAATRENFLKEYHALDVKAKATQRTLQERGDLPCPLSSERQAALQEALSWLLPASPPLEHRLKDSVQRGRLVALLKALQTRPPLMAEINPPEEAQRIILELSLQIAEARENFFDQEHWRPVQDVLRKKLARVVKEHLPATLERLWCELWINLTSAPWLLSARPGFDVALKRGQQRAVVRVGDRLARYILNQAETHLLGLGWFFTRYLTRGRFCCHALVMDDPAQQLDQTSYRDLCRLWRVLMRLHSIYKLPLRMILFLHQEDRALDAARATRGLVDVLGWSIEQAGTPRELELFAPNAKPSHPSAWFQAERATA
jgi:energy-coupling factor transporter ATP-binding protein EcfA2